MTSADAFYLVIALVVGVIAGVVFFGGLWLTVNRMMTARHPVLLMIASLLVRAAIVLALFYIVSAGDVYRIVASLAGFLLARFVVVRRLEPGSKVTQE